jgi:hypothetical protein
MAAGSIADVGGLRSATAAIACGCAFALAWIQDLRMIAGPRIVNENDMVNGAEAYLQMWVCAEAAARR